MKRENELVVAEDISLENAPSIYVEGGLKPFIEQVRAEVSAEVPDISTRKGRERIASLAAKVSKSKTAVEKPGRDYLRHLKAQPKVVEAELREFVQAMDALRDETRKPLTEWEQAEEARVAALQERVQHLMDFAEVADLHAAGIQVQIHNLEAIAVGDDFEEFEPEAHRVKAASLTALREALVKRQQYETEQAELERLRQEAAEREQREREDRIAREAEDRARREAEQQAQAEREAVARREAEAKAASERRELELRLQAEQAEKAALEAQRRAEQAAQHAEEREKAAAEAERQRIADEKAKEEAEAAARERNKKHKAAVNNDALQAFIAGGMPEECAKQAVVLIAKGLIPNIRISY